MMEYKEYIGKVEFDDEANIFHGEVVGIRDVITFQGENVRELRRAFEESVDDYLAFCAERGEKPDKPCSGKFLVRLSPELHRHAAMLAKVRGESLNALVAEAIEREIQLAMPDLQSA